MQCINIIITNHSATCIHFQLPLASNQSSWRCVIVYLPHFQVLAFSCFEVQKREGLTRFSVLQATGRTRRWSCVCVCVCVCRSGCVTLWSYHQTLFPGRMVLSVEEACSASRTSPVPPWRTFTQCRAIHLTSNTPSISLSNTPIWPFPCSTQPWDQ